MNLHGHSFRLFGQEERICRCGFVIPAEATAKEVEELMIEHLGFVSQCSGEWHVHRPVEPADGYLPDGSWKP